MRFKKWFFESVVGTSVLHGGIGEAPNDGVNIGLPVRSKTSCQDGSPPHEEENGKSPEDVFGFRTKLDKKRSKERKATSIDKARFPLSGVKPSSIGFSS
jgi:hypothetical protein